MFKLFDKNKDGLISSEELRGEILLDFKDVFKDLSQLFPPDRGKEQPSKGILDQWSTLHRKQRAIFPNGNPHYQALRSKLFKERGIVMIPFSMSKHTNCCTLFIVGQPTVRRKV